VKGIWKRRAEDGDCYDLDIWVIGSGWALRDVLYDFLIEEGGWRMV